MNERQKKSMLAKYKLFSTRASKKSLSDFAANEIEKFNLHTKKDKVNKSNKIARSILSCFDKKELVKYFFYPHLPKKTRREYEKLDKHQLINIIMRGVKTWQKF